MRMLKCYLAITSLGHHITAEDAVSTGPKVWSCIHCGCRLILHAAQNSNPSGLSMISAMSPTRC
ncbi:zinc-ribbon domain-containing protein [Enterobacter sp. 638]|uniref:zinc-ribbon domain-containing protein n=1 Tax=Enterobacter sp. (strain 638) TaxID=399742 RepID=UPI001CC04968